jgi:hypothetical protein
MRKKPAQSWEYEYDFGNGWRHEVVFVGFFPKESTLKYPRCLDGRRACPPEDCGGIGGHQDLLGILADSSLERRVQKDGGVVEGPCQELMAVQA